MKLSAATALVLGEEAASRIRLQPNGELFDVVEDPLIGRNPTILFYLAEREHAEEKMKQAQDTARVRAIYGYVEEFRAVSNARESLSYIFT